jgi:hypothetical protein
MTGTVRFVRREETPRFVRREVVPATGGEGRG